MFIKDIVLIVRKRNNRNYGHSLISYNNLGSRICKNWGINLEEIGQKKN